MSRTARTPHPVLSMSGSQLIVMTERHSYVSKHVSVLFDEFIRMVNVLLQLSIMINVFITPH